MRITGKILRKIGFGSGTISYKEPERDPLVFIDSLDRPDLEIVHKRIQARAKQLRTDDPMVYGLRSSNRGIIRFHTCSLRRGERQMLAQDWQHSYLWLTSSRVWADKQAKWFKERPNHPHTTYDVFQIPKLKAMDLPCYEHCKYNESQTMMGGLLPDPERMRQSMKAIEEGRCQPLQDVIDELCTDSTGEPCPQPTPPEFFTDPRTGQPFGQS